MASRSRTNIRLEEACAKYMQRITNEGQADASLYTAKYALARLQRTIATRREPNPWVHNITAEAMDDYCYGSEGIRANIKSVSFNRYRSVLVKFFEYGIVLRWTDVNPMDGIPSARPDAPVSRLRLSAGELLALLDYCSNPVQRIACSIGMNTGLRGNDVRRLTVFDASLTTGTIQTEIRKTRKLDVKPITLDLANELLPWLDTYAQLMGLSDRGELPNEWLLVPSYRQPTPQERNQTVRLRPLQVHTHPWNLVQRPLARMGYPTKGEGFHTLRRSSARALFESLRDGGEGRDHALMIVKEYLNHSSVAQTEHYLGMNQERAIRDTILRDKPFLTRMVQAEQARIAEEPVRLSG